MKYAIPVFVILLVILVSFNASAQKKAPDKPGDKDTLGVYVNAKNEKVYFFGMFQVTQESVNYKTKLGDAAYESVNRIKWAKLGDRVFLACPKSKKAKHKNLMEVAAINSKYILMRCYESYNGIYFYNYYIFDFKGNIIVEDTYDLGKEEIVRDTVTKYFGDCPDFIKRMDYNKKHEKFILSDFNNLTCPGALKLEPLMEALEREEWKVK